MSVSSDRSGHPGRSALAFRFLARSLTLRGASFALSLLAVTTAAAVTATMLNLEADLGAKMSTELRRYGPNLLVMPSGTAAGQTLDETGVRVLPAAARLSPGVSVSPLLLVSGAVAAATAPGAEPAESVDSEPPAAGRDTASAIGEGGASEPAGASAATDDRSETGAGAHRGAHPATIAGCDFAALREQNPTWRLEGTWPSPAARACVVGVSLARRAGIVAAGQPRPASAAPTAGSGRDVLRLPAGSGAGGAVLWTGSAGDGLILPVAGILSSGEEADEQVFVPLALVQTAAALPGRVSLAALAVEGGTASVEAASRAIEAALPGASARPLRQIAEAQGAILAKLRRMMGLLTGAVLVLSALCLSTTLMSVVIEREAEIGLMRSIGASDRNVLVMFVGEVGLLGAVGGLLGLGVAALAGRWIGVGLFGTPIDPRLSVVPAVLGAAIGLCLLSVLLPIRRAMTIQPAAALRGD